MNCIHCDISIPDKRVEILIRQGQPFTCVNCSEVERVVGFQVHHDKACRTIDVVSSPEYQRLHSLERKGGGATGINNPDSLNKKQGKVVYKPKNKKK